MTLLVYYWHQRHRRMIPSLEKPRTIVFILYPNYNFLFIELYRFFTKLKTLIIEFIFYPNLNDWFEVNKNRPNKCQHSKVIIIVSRSGRKCRYSFNINLLINMLWNCSKAKLVWFVYHRIFGHIRRRPYDGRKKRSDATEIVLSRESEPTPVKPLPHLVLARFHPDFWSRDHDFLNSWSWLFNLVITTY